MWLLLLPGAGWCQQGSSPAFLAAADPEMRVTGPLDRWLTLNHTYQARLAAGSARCGNGGAGGPDVISW